MSYFQETWQHVTSGSNPLLKELRKLAESNNHYRAQQHIWVEGDHLIRAAAERGWKTKILISTENFVHEAQNSGWLGTEKNIILPEPLFRNISQLESSSQIGALFDLPAEPTILPNIPTVILDRVQDIGNVGSILRSSSAFGFKQVLALKGGAALWSAKALRAGMGAHFGLNLVESVSVEALAALQMPIATTSSHLGEPLGRCVLPTPLAWVFGHEGQGVSPELMAQAAHQYRIEQPGGEESLGVAAAASICLFSSSLAYTR